LDAEEKEPGLREHFDTLRRRKGRGLAVASVLFAMIVVVTMVWPTKYESSATILLEQQEIPQEMVRSTITSFADQRIQIISQQVMTTANLLRIIEKYDLYPRMVRSRPREVVLEEMRDDISMNMISAEVVDPRSGRPTSATIAFTLGYRGRSPDQALKVANELTNLYLQKNVESRTSVANEITDFLSGEADRLSGEIRTLEEYLSAFKAENVNRLPELNQLNLSLLDRSERELADIDRQLRTLDERRIFLESESARLNGPSTIYSESGERMYSPQDRLKYLESELATLEALYSDRHPDVLRTRREIEGLKASLAEIPGQGEEADDTRSLLAERSALNGRLSEEHPEIEQLDRRISGRASFGDENSDDESTDPSYVQVKAQLAAVLSEQSSLRQLREQTRARVVDIERRLAESPIIEKDYVALNLELDNARAKYRDVKAREMEAMLAQNMESDRKGERLTLIEPPLPPEQPASPDRPLLILSGFFLSFFGGGIAIVLAEAADESIRTRRSFEDLIALPTMGLIPFIETDVDVQKRRKKLCVAGAAAVAALILVATIVHLVIIPIDVLWYSALRRL